MVESNTDAGNLRLLEVPLCLNFANTTNQHIKSNPKEWLKNYGDVIAWGYHAGIIADKKRKLLSQRAKNAPNESQKIYKQTIELRTTIYNIFSTIAHNEQVNSKDLSRLSSTLGSSYQFAEIVEHQKKEFMLVFNDGTETLDCILWPIVHSSINLLFSDKLRKVKQCEEETCDWLFLDTSRNQSRRWCSMETCGNRAKVHRHRAKRPSVK